MNLLLVLALVTAAGVAYFEYTVEQQTSAGFQKQTAAWQSQLDSLKMDNRELKDAKTQVDVRIDDAQSQVAKLSAQASQGQPATNTASATPTTTAAAPAPAAPTAALQVGASLGTITSSSGDVFLNCKLLKIETDGVTFSHATGIRKLLFTDMTTDDQKRFGYDPSNPPAAPQPMAQ
jgi:hypothetical protein